MAIILRGVAMNFKNYRSAFPISNNKIVEFGKIAESDLTQSENKTLSQSESSATNSYSSGANTPYVDFFSNDITKQKPQTQQNVTKKSDTVSVASYKSFLSQHDKLSQEIDDKNKK